MSGFPAPAGTARASGPDTAPLTAATGTTGRRSTRKTGPARVGGRTPGRMRRFVHIRAGIRILPVSTWVNVYKWRTPPPSGSRGPCTLWRAADPRTIPDYCSSCPQTHMKPRVLIAPAPLRDIEPVYGPTLTAAGFELV